MSISVQSQQFMNSPKSEATDLGGGIHRTILGFDDHILMAKVWFEAGAVGDVHTHPHSQVSYIISGKFEAEIDGHKQIVEEGGSLFMPSMVPHGSVCLEAGVLLDIFSPVREDFLKEEGVIS